MKKNSKYLYLALLISWMGLIIYNSAQTADLSMDATFFFTDFFNRLFHTTFFGSDLFITLFRKTAHFVEYFILGWLGYMTSRGFMLLKGKYPWWLIFCCVAFAISDETHQIFVEGRAFKWLDILIDSLGAFTSITIMRKFFVQFKH